MIKIPNETYNIGVQKLNKRCLIKSYPNKLKVELLQGSSYWCH